MLRSLLISAFAFLVWFTCSRKELATSSSSDTIPSEKDSIVVSRIDFDKEIKPIFQSHCMPCHFTGGKMYEKLPFDKAQTIRDHQEGILRRIKGEGDVKKLQEFLATEK